MASWNDLQAARQNDLMRYYNSKVVQQDQATPQSAALQEKKNKGGFFGGVGYTLEKLGLGTLRSIEGMTDYLVGGAADILGQDDFAEELMKSDWVNYEHADEWYNPNKVMSFVGDVSSGVGGMLPSITAAAAVTLATGGAGAGVGAGVVGVVGVTTVPVLPPVVVPPVVPVVVPPSSVVPLVVVLLFFGVAFFSTVTVLSATASLPAASATL